MSTKSRFNHPIGISYVEIANAKPNKYENPDRLPDLMRLFDGRIGCGTCHNAASKRKRMLTISNKNSKMCEECHIM